MNPEEEPQDSTYLDRLAAMSLLRENIFLANPSTYAMTDVAEDLPGNLRAVGSRIKNLLPSKAIISEDPEERKAQIQAAVERVKASRGNKENLGKEMFHSAVDMGKHSIIPSAVLAAAVQLLGPRLPFAKGKLRSVITPVKNLKQIFNRKNYAKLLARNTMHDTAIGAAWAAGTGAAMPALAQVTGVSDNALAEAQKIMEEQPYITGLDSTEMLSIIKQKRDEMHGGAGDKLKNIGLGAGLEAGLSVGGAVIPAAFPLGGKALMNLIRGRKLSQGINAAAAFNKFKRSAKSMALFGGVLGGIGGATTNNLIEDKMEEIKANKEQAARKNQPANEQPPAGTYPA